VEEAEDADGDEEHKPLPPEVPKGRRFSGTVPHVQDFHGIVENLEIDLVGVMFLSVEDSPNLGLWTPRGKLDGNWRAAGRVAQGMYRLSQALEPFRPPDRSILQ
jgi:hypothetical protein